MGGFFLQLANLKLRQQGVSTVVGILAGVAVVAGTFSATDDRTTTASLLLALFILLVAWSRGAVFGAIAGIVAAALLIPYGGNRYSLFDTTLPTSVWPYLAVCYVVLGVFVGLRGAGYRRLQQINEELGVLNAINATFTRLQDVAQVQTTVLAQIGNLLHPDIIQLFEISPDGERFILKTARPALPDTDMRTPPSVAVREGIFGKVVLSQRLEMISALQNNLHLRPLTIPDEITSIIAVPLHSQARVIAILILGREASRVFNTTELHFMESIEQACTVALENAEMYQQVREQSYSDELTGLGNRRMLNLRMMLEVDRASLAGQPLCLAMLDLDFFKRVNDVYGHLAGDQVLRKFAHRVQEQIRTADLFCRIGGEEFVLVTPETTLAAMTLIAGRICHAVQATPFILDDGTELKVTVSIGVAELQGTTLTTDTLLAAADQALYTAKANGRNRVEIFEEDTPAAEQHTPITA
ncbi:MAG: sensor domain-containing diguanylate cyclase [Armatimonadota bacterium]